MVDWSKIVAEKDAEINRLRAGGCARDQGLTQYCAEAERLARENERLRADANDRCPVDAMDRGMTPVEAAVWHVWGERCSDFEPECLTCRAWLEFDEVERLRIELLRIAGHPELYGTKAPDFARAALSGAYVSNPDAREDLSRAGSLVPVNPHDRVDITERE